MTEIPISKFKATCLAVIARVQKTKTPVRITKFGAPIADLYPTASTAGPQDWFGSMEGTAEILGDIVAPSGDESDWEAARE